ncbi:hypothetical protein GCM10027431_27810 [Lysobacter rhizosphaerae]
MSKVPAGVKSFHHDDDPFRDGRGTWSGRWRRFSTSGWASFTDVTKFVSPHSRGTCIPARDRVPVVLAMLARPRH